jgi:hypothetical protein
MNIRIKKAKLKGRRVTLDYYNTVEQGSDAISVKCANLAHPDLLEAMDKLTPHFILLCELPEREALLVMLSGGMTIEDVETSDFPKVQVTGYATGGKDEEEGGLTITGNRLLSGGKQLNIVSPPTKYHEDEYEYAGELSLAVQAVEDEIYQFLNGKISNKQLDIFEDTNADADDPFAGTGEEAPATQKPKRGRKKKGAAIETDAA